MGAIEKGSEDLNCSAPLSRADAVPSTAKNPEPSVKKLTFIDMFAEIGGVETLLSKIKEKSVGKRLKKSSGSCGNVEQNKVPPIDDKVPITNEAMTEVDAPADRSKLERRKRPSQADPTRCVVVLERLPKHVVEKHTVHLKDITNSGSAKTNGLRKQPRDQMSSCFVLLERLPARIVDKPSIKMGDLTATEGSLWINAGIKASSGSSTSGGRLYRCSMCSFGTSNPIHLKRHKKIHRKHLALRTCPDCGYSSPDASSMRSHQCRVGDKDVECRYCELTFAPLDLQTHLWEKHARLLGSIAKGDGTVPYSCYYCSFVTLDKKILKNHILVHMEKVPMHAIEFHGGRLFHVCHYCSFKSWRLGDIKRHFLESKAHASVGMYGCSYCGMACLTKAALVKHTITKHERHKLKTSVCKKCGDKFPDQFKLRSHMGLHSRARDGRKKECNLCGLKVIRLESHYLNAHTNARLYPCSQCDARFRQKTGLDYHLLTHNNTKDFACTKCDFRTHRMYILKEHALVHSDARDFPCKQCKHSAKSNARLIKHVNAVHRKVKPHKCPECKYRSVTASTMRFHMAKHTSAKPFGCPFCTVRYTRPYNVRCHVGRVHPKMAKEYVQPMRF